MPASGGAMVLKPGMNLANSSDRAPWAEGSLGAPHARVGLEGDAAHPAEDTYAADTADPVPDRVGDQRGHACQGQHDGQGQVSAAGQATGRE
jgi:hypothetical protein